MRVVELSTQPTGPPTGSSTGSAPSRPGPLARVLLVPIRWYQRWLSPVLPPACRFQPSCSNYAVEALQTHGALRGGWLALRRLLRCGPWHPGGLDPVPPRSPGPACPTDLPQGEE